MWFQLFLIVFAVVAILRTWNQYTKRQVSKYWFVVWAALWLAVIVVAVTPQTADFAAQIVGVERGADLLVYTAVVVLAYMTFRLTVRQQKLNEEITELVRKIAVDHPERR